MTSLSFVLFLGLFLVFSLALYVIANILDLMKLGAAQKLVVLKTGLLFLMMAPLIFLSLSAVAFKTIEVRMPSFSVEPSTQMPNLLLPMSSQRIDWPLSVALAYALGVSLVTISLVRNYFLTKKWLSDSVEETLQGQAVRLSSRVTSPLSFGFFHPEIYFPRAARDGWTGREIQMGLSHERNHIMRNDPLWKLISLFVRSLLFFAPWMHALHRKLELEMEILCDESTRLQTQAEIEEYGSFLLSLVVHEKSRNSLVTNMSDSTLKRRIIAMKSRKIQRPVFVAVLSACMLLIGTTAIATSSGVSEKKSIYKISSVLSLNGRELSRPRLVVVAGEEALIRQVSDGEDVDLKMTLVSKDAFVPKMGNGIGIAFDIQYRIGDLTGRASPQIIVMPGREGQITIGGDDGQVFDLRVTAERQ
ncbi:MAG: M56 family metallopeptidase [Bdellovibrionaceae bacterium]|nr:M56 family metallopeptidase [Pseudobdellovibrionaceae bacterium]